MPISIKKRSVAVVIDTPEDDKLKSVYYNREAKLYDGDEYLGMAKTQPQPIGFRLVDEASVMRTAVDPVTGQEATVSIAGIAALIRADYDARQAAEDAAIATQSPAI
jgi:hypothetical protein